MPGAIFNRMHELRQHEFEPIATPDIAPCVEIVVPVYNEAATRTFTAQTVDGVVVYDLSSPNVSSAT